MQGLNIRVKITFFDHHLRMAKHEYTTRFNMLPRRILKVDIFFLLPIGNKTNELFKIFSWGNKGV